MGQHQQAFTMENYEHFEGRRGILPWEPTLEGFVEGTRKGPETRVLQV